jgi:hypothetical protein
MCDVHPLPMRKNYDPHLACVPSASRLLAVFGFLILGGEWWKRGEIVHVTGCAVLKIGLKKMKTA